MGAIGEGNEGAEDLKKAHNSRVVYFTYITSIPCSSHYWSKEEGDGKDHAGSMICS